MLTICWPISFINASHLSIASNHPIHAVSSLNLLFKPIRTYIHSFPPLHPIRCMHHSMCGNSCEAAACKDSLFIQFSWRSPFVLATAFVNLVVDNTALLASDLASGAYKKQSCGRGKVGEMVMLSGIFKTAHTH